MITVAMTENGIGKIWFNNDSKQESALVFTGDVPEIIGDMTNEEFESYDDIEQINAQLYGMSFTEKPTY